MEEKERDLPGIPLLLHLRFAFPSRNSFGNKLERRREDVTKAASQFLVIGKKAPSEFFWASSIAMVYCGTRG